MASRLAASPDLPFVARHTLTMERASRISSCLGVVRAPP